ncbi:MAG: imidazole glycerol phosphate synthase subunit HisH [Bacillota bacterium]
MIAIIDYGAGNLFSVKNALDFLKIPNIITSNKEEIESASGIILPGVGAFPKAMQMLNATGLAEFLKEQTTKKPLLGICLGMQMLFETSYEFEKVAGLGLIPGEIKPIPNCGLKIPHMGWNNLEITNESSLLQGVKEGEHVYFVHSYMAYTDKKYISAVASYGEKITGVVQNGNVFGTQFHPEKSGEVGLKMLTNFWNLASGGAK